MNFNFKAFSFSPSYFRVQEKRVFVVSLMWKICIFKLQKFALSCFFSRRPATIIDDLHPDSSLFAPGVSYASVSLLLLSRFALLFACFDVDPSVRRRHKRSGWNVEVISLHYLLRVFSSRAASAAICALSLSLRRWVLKLCEKATHQCKKIKRETAELIGCCWLVTLLFEIKSCMHREMIQLISFLINSSEKRFFFF